jgi:hypothetical protein
MVSYLKLKIQIEGFNLDTKLCIICPLQLIHLVQSIPVASERVFFYVGARRNISSSHTTPQLSFGCCTPREVPSARLKNLLSLLLTVVQ